MTALRLTVVHDAFRCEPLARTMTRAECVAIARHAYTARGPKVERACTSCRIGEAHMRGAQLAAVSEPPATGKRTSAPTMIELDGEWVSMSEAARRTNLDRSTIRYRMARGIPLDAPSRQKRAVAVEPADSRTRLIVALRAQGYACEARVLDGEEVLVVREVAR